MMPAQEVEGNPGMSRWDGVVMAVDKRSSRLGVLAVVAVLLLGVLGTRLWFLQGTQQAVSNSG